MDNPLFPRSATRFPINLIGLLCFLAALLSLQNYPDLPPSHKVLIIVLSWSVPIALLELLTIQPLKNSRLFNFTEQNSFNIRRSTIKLLGLTATISAVALFYWLPPEYHGDFYRPFWEILNLTAPVLLLFTIPYIILTDRLMAEPEDSYYQLGLWLLGKNPHCNKQLLVQHFLGWLVKAYFLPLMLIYLSQNIRNFHPDWQVVFSSFRYFFNTVWDICFTVDLGIVCAGYTLTFKILDSHIRSTEPTLFGWFVALMCYQPFNNLFAANYFAYDRDHYGWGAWLHDSPVLYQLWGGIILILVIIYALASVSFGLRFSNLTHRGIITDGVYRYTKHPAYLAKNLSWWFIAIPFIAYQQSYWEAVRNILMLLAWNGIYYLRAKTEERHLAQDPVYRDYMLAIEQHGMIAKLKRLIGFK